MVKGTWLDYESVMAKRYLVYRELLVLIFVRPCTYVVLPYMYVLYLHTLAGTLDECLLVCCEFMF